MAIINDSTKAAREPRAATIKVWDPFVRVFHWSLVSFFAITWVTADEWDRVHELAGYAIAILVGLRVLWGLIGPRHARFRDFVYRPAAVIGYLKDSVRLRGKRYLGHNPAGGAMIVALLLSLAATIVTGIMMSAEHFWGTEWIEELHEVTANVTLGLVALHVAGVILSSLAHGENLIRAMITGLKQTDD